MSQQAPLERPDLDRTPRLATFAHGVAASFFAAMYAPNGLALLAFAGGVIGALLGVRLARTRLRTVFVAVPGALVIVAAVVAYRGLISADPLSSALGPLHAMRAAEVVLFPLASLGVSLSLRALSTRWRGFIGLEILAFALVALQLFVDHRFGAINRPFEIADPMLAAGRDPTLAFELFGAVAVAVIGLLMMRERSVPRAVYHLVALSALVLSCVVTTAIGKLPTPPPPENGLGLRSDESEGRDSRGGRGGTGGSSGERPQSSQRRRVAVAVVVFHDDYSSPVETYYLRQESFSRFEGPRLVAGIDPDLMADFPERETPVAEPPPEVSDRELVRTTVALVAPHDHPFGLEAPLRFAPTENPDPSRFERAYSVTSRSSVLPFEELLEARVGSSSWSPERRALYTAPHPDPRYRPLAEQIIAEMLPEDLRSNQLAQVAAITTWLGREGQYSLHHLQDDGPDPATEFLFGERIGFCVHFAHSAVHLMRSVGIPSRVGAGYAVPESNRQGGSSMLVSDDLGHAWPEVYVEGAGWMIADVSPERSLEPPNPPPDIELTRILGEMVRGEPPPPPPEAPPIAEVITAISEHADDAGRWAFFGFGGFALGLYLLKAFRRFAPLFVPAHWLPRTGYRSVIDALAEVGLRRMRGETREGFAERLGARIPTLATLTAANVAEAFGGRSHREDLVRLRAESRTAIGELARSVPLWRRLLGYLDPISFLTSR